MCPMSEKTKVTKQQKRDAQGRFSWSLGWDHLPERRCCDHSWSHSWAQCRADHCEGETLAGFWDISELPVSIFQAGGTHKYGDTDIPLQGCSQPQKGSHC